jgi:predicted RNase H-like HicB family nuclease
MTKKFHVSIEKDKAGFYFGRCDELPSAFAQASTLSELKQRLPQVIDLALQRIEADSPSSETIFRRSL